MPDFTHLHVHTQYSILDGAAKISGLLNKAKEHGMNALAITDHGNMFGVLKFSLKQKKQALNQLLVARCIWLRTAVLINKAKDRGVLIT